MRIAVSGTHCSGKTTLIEEFLRVHTDFTHEPEAYTVLVEDFGEEFSSEPGADDFYRQLEFNVERLRQYPPGERVVYERCPVDYLAYLLALKDLHREEVDSLIERVLGMVRGGLRYLDVIVFLPLDETDGIATPESEDPKLRRAVDSRLKAIFGDDEFGIVSSGSVAIVEASGSTAQRLRMVQNALKLANH
jgi:predicted ATPase